MVIIEDDYHPIDRELILKRRISFLKEEIERLEKELALIEENKQ